MLFLRRMSRIFSTSWLSIPRFRLIFMDSVKVSGFAHFSAAFGEYLLMFSPDYVSSAYLVGGLAAEKLRTLSVCHLLPSLRLQVSLSCSPRPRAIMSCQRPELQARRHMPSGGAAVVDALTDRNTHVSNFSSVSVYIFVFLDYIILYRQLLNPFFFLLRRACHNCVSSSEMEPRGSFCHHFQSCGPQDWSLKKR